MFSPLTVKITMATIIFVIGLLFFIWYGHQPPNSFPTDEVITIEPNGLRGVAETLRENEIIRSSWLFLAYSHFSSAERPIQSGSYIFHRPLTVRDVITQLKNGANGTRVYRLTHTEGRTIAQLTKQVSSILPSFDTQLFLQLADGYEGKLFPDTYFIAAGTSPDELHQLLYQTYVQRVRDGRAQQIADHTLSEYEVIILASIIEREANTPESKRMVAGVLLNRLDIDMPLQADASIEYVLDKPLYELTPEDLRIDSPYNTYTNNGLPPTPINNPGLNAIDAVLQPADTDYLYYITAPDGTFHFARDFDKHRQNIQRYLR